MDASNSLTGSPPLQFPSSDLQRPSSSPGYSSPYERIGQPPSTPTQNEPVSPPLAASSSAFPGSASPMPDYSPLEKNPVMWKRFNEMVIIHIPKEVQNDYAGQVSTYTFPAGEVFKKTVEMLFQWVAGCMRTILPSHLSFVFLNTQSTFLEKRMILQQGESNFLQALKTIAWKHFINLLNPDPAVGTINILITPIFPPGVGGSSENMQQQPQQLHSPTISPNNPSDPPPNLSVSNQIASGITPHSASRQSTNEPGPRPPFGPSPQSRSFPISQAPVTAKTSMPSSTATHRTKDTPERHFPNSNNNNNIVEAQASSNLNQQHQPQQPPVQDVPPARAKPDNSTPSTAQISIRIQVDGQGRLSRRYDKSTLNPRITSSRFFAWFAQETGRAAPGKLRFDFKDALPAKSSVIAACNDDHFDLMVRDIRRKFERAVEFVPNMSEFCIVVTDPQWDSGEEDEDEDR